MNLHKDKDAFKAIIDNINERTDLRKDVLEKDYYVCLILEELSKLQKEGLKAYFKGGTALYKALGLTNRFSEDIDISVDGRGLSRTGNDKALEKATKKYISMERKKDESRSFRSSIETVYVYEPINEFDRTDILQRFGKLKVEATSFTIAEPTEELVMHPLIYEKANQYEKEILESQYDIKPIPIITITMERIFVDKLFASESYFRKSYDTGKAFDTAKHIYDLTILSEQDRIKDFLKSPEEFNRVVNIRLEEELNRLDGIPNIALSEFTFFENVKNVPNIINAYNKMQEQYIFNNSDKISFEKVNSTLKNLECEIKKITKTHENLNLMPLTLINTLSEVINNLDIAEINKTLGIQIDVNRNISEQIYNCLKNFPEERLEELSRMYAEEVKKIEPL